MSMLVRKGTMLHRNPSRRSSRGGRRSSRAGSISAGSSFRLKKGESHASTATGSGGSSTNTATTTGHDTTTDRDHEMNRNATTTTTPSGRNSVSEPFSSVEIELQQDSSSYSSPHHHHHNNLHHNGSMLNGSATAVYLSPKSIYSSGTNHYKQTSLYKLSPSSSAIQLDEFCSSNRRSSSISQVSPGEDRRKLYRYSKFAYDSHEYGSLWGQLKEANEEATSGLDFTNKFFSIICKSAFATSFFVILAILPLSMAFVGVKNLQECPLQPHLPIYFLVCGVFGLLRVIWALYEQLKLRRYEHCNASFFEEDTIFGSTALKVIQWALNGFLLFWFLLGNIWIASLHGPNGPPQFISSLQNPNMWCSKQLFIFSLAHLYFLYGLAGLFVLMWILSFCVIPIQRHLIK